MKAVWQTLQMLCFIIIVVNSDQEYLLSHDPFESDLDKHKATLKSGTVILLVSKSFYYNTYL